MRLDRDAHGTIRSPGYPGNYPASRDCVWVLYAHVGQTLRITLGHVDIAPSRNCTADMLEIRDSASSYRYQVSRYRSGHHREARGEDTGQVIIYIPGEQI